jgi:hypothetical protein
MTDGFVVGVFLRNRLAPITFEVDDEEARELVLLAPSPELARAMSVAAGPTKEQLEDRFVLRTAYAALFSLRVFAKDADAGFVSYTANATRGARIDAIEFIEVVDRVDDSGSPPPREYRRTEAGFRIEQGQTTG